MDAANWNTHFKIYVKYFWTDIPTFQQTIDTPVGTYYAPLFADLLYSDEAEFFITAYEASQ